MSFVNSVKLIDENRVLSKMVSSLSEEKERLKEDKDSTHRLFNEVKYHKIETCILFTRCYWIWLWLSSKHAALRGKSKDWLAGNQDNVSKWCDMSICGLLSN